MLIFTSYVSYGILNSNIDMKIEKKNGVAMATNSRFICPLNPIEKAIFCIISTIYYI